MMKFRHNFQ